MEDKWNIEDHIKAVDWNRVHMKSKELEKAKRELGGILMPSFMLTFISKMGIISLLEQFEHLWGAYSPIPNIKLMLKVIPFVLLVCFAYSGYKYLKWSRYDVMRTQ